MSYRSWDGSEEDVEFSTLAGETLLSVKMNKNEDEDEILFTGQEKKWKMCHYQDCCESVLIEEVVGDLNDLIGSPIVRAEENSNKNENCDDFGASETWTFYRIATQKGTVMLRWRGQSNGYYSESVSFVQLHNVEDTENDHEKDD